MPHLRKNFLVGAAFVCIKISIMCKMERFDEIPAQLQKHEKKFKLSSLKKDARFRDYEDAMIVNHCYNTTAPNIGLKLNMERMTLKCYMTDAGLLISHAFDENGIVYLPLYMTPLL